MSDFRLKKKGGGKKGKEKEVGDSSTSVNSDNWGQKEVSFIVLPSWFHFGYKRKKERKKGARERRKPWILLAGSLNAMFLLCCLLIHSHLRI